MRRAGRTRWTGALAALRSPEPAALPKGLSAPTLEAVIRTLRAAKDGATATGTGAEVGISRITARRYLEHLVTTGRAVRAPTVRAGRAAGNAVPLAEPPVICPADTPTA